MKSSSPQAGFFTPRLLIAFALCSAGILLAIAGLANPPPGIDKNSEPIKDPGLATPALPASTESVWSVMLSPNASAAVDGVAGGVACISSSNCFAVGYYNNGSSYQTLIEQWNGSSWSVVASPNSGFTQTNYLFAVTCTSATQCFAVGYYGGNSSVQTLIEQWNGTSWSIISSPNSSVTQNNYQIGRASCRERV